MDPALKRPASRLRVLIAAALLCLALTVGVTLAACGGGDEASLGDGPFAGLWEPSDASFDVTWNEEEGKMYAISSGGSGGGFEIRESEGELAVTLVGTSGGRSDAFPAAVEGDTLTFAIPIFEDDPTDVTMLVSSDGTANVKFESDQTGWDFRKTETIATEE